MESNPKWEDPLFGYHLIRNDVLSELLGAEKESLLYWLGKSVARTHPVESVEELSLFFDKAHWGALELIKEKPYERTFELTGSWMDKHDQRSYYLEAGFIAQQIEAWTQSISVAVITEKKQAMQIHVTIDRHDPVDET
ncbi:YslB family protein [Alkalicoccobacillus porphyridii]|uniref:DUF2507 domain-containing protein n=1 Tax=Alkalicoccobacillus porphyridii TaxID=2597270 RepID=A0A554A2T1_9BACI|nr:YslB family protein [Alkalicoccobacillus porphyridii]TSB47993.1 DUF2507 domain-containing protein [Alkalicoccobacillus porphyridii]